MSKLIDIKGYWNMDYSEDFNCQDMWEGQILLEEDGWFEGIVLDSNNTNKKDRFIFGVYFPEKVIRLFKLIPLNVFDATKNYKGYVGEVKTIGLFGTMPCGSSYIDTQERLEIKQNIKEDKQLLEARIQNYKNTMMDKTGKEFYENSIAIRKTLTQVILRNYEGRGFTKSELEELRKEFEPVNERVCQSNRNAVQKLVREIPKDTFEDDEELPF